MVARACNPSYSGGWGRRITWTQEAEVAVSQDLAIALQPGLQSETLSEKKKRIYMSSVANNSYMNPIFRWAQKTSPSGHKSFHANKFENLAEMDNFSENKNLSKLSRVIRKHK